MKPKLRSLTLNANRFAAAAAGLVAVLCAVAAADVRTNAANVGFQLLEEPINPMLLGMGSAGTANASRGFSYYNPALPALLEKPYLSVEYGRYSAGDLQRGHFETAWPFAKWFVGASAHTEAIDDIISTDYFGRVSPNETFSSQLTTIALDAGLVRGHFALGLCLNGTQERIAEYRAYALSASAGVVYSPIPRKLVFGLSAFHLGMSTSMIDTTYDWGEGARLPKTGRFGVAWTDTIKGIGYTAVADVVFRNADLRVMVPVGVEVRFLEQVAVRIGKRINHDTEILNLGAGLSLPPLSCDVSFVIPKLVEDAELKWLLAITYTLKGAPGLRKSTVTVSEKEAAVVKPAQEPVSDSLAVKSGDTAEEQILIEELPEEPVIKDTSAIDTTAAPKAAEDGGSDTGAPSPSSNDEPAEEHEPAQAQEPAEAQEP